MLKVAYDFAAIYFPFIDLIVADPYEVLSRGLKVAFYMGQSHIVGDTTIDIVVVANDATQAQIIDLVRELQGRIGLSALFITHDLNSVRSLAHNVAVMRLGKIVEYGETERIFATPQQAYTKMLLSAELPIE